jgi:hypothetical protein
VQIEEPQIYDKALFQESEIATEASGHRPKLKWLRILKIGKRPELGSFRKQTQPSWRPVSFVISRFDPCPGGFVPQNTAICARMASFRKKGTGTSLSKSSDRFSRKLPE